MIRRTALFAFALLLFACSTAGPSAGKGGKATDYSGYMVVSTEPAAAEAGAAVLKRGGSAVDAAVAVEAVLGLIEPPSSGVGGGSFLVYRDSATAKITTYDGRETAPASTKPDQFLGPDGKPSFDKWFGGDSVGVPGTMAMLALAHKDHGKLPWAGLFDPAIKLADGGFPVDAHLHDYTARARGLKDWPGVGYLFDSNGEALPVGTIIRNTAFARTLEALAKNPRAINEGPIAEDIAKAVSNAYKNPQPMTVKDLASYEAKERAPVCGPYRQYVVCGMGLPSSGGITILEILGMLQRFDLSSLGPDNPLSWHLIAEAERLAYADRARYLGDSDIVDVPVKGLLDAGYLKSRSELIDPDHAAGVREAGTPPQQSGALYVPGVERDHPSTTHFTIVDASGNVAAMTSSIQLGFGSHIFVDGFFLNNELTDFSMVPSMNGKPVANAAGPGKRPLSSMSPTIVMDKNGKFVMAVGSPGGRLIISFVVKSLIGVLDWNLSMQNAVDLPNVANMNGNTLMEDAPSTGKLKAALEAKGHEVSVLRLPSQLQGIRVVPGGYQGGTDKRRGGKIVGEKPIPAWRRALGSL